MSEFRIEVVRLGPLTKHPNADSLSITYVHKGYPCIVRTTDFKEGDLAAYIVIDSEVSLSRPEFAFLKKANSTRERARIRAVKLRGTFSMGLLLPAPPGSKEGDDVQEHFGITKYEPPLDVSMGGNNERCPFHFPKFTDIEGYRRYPDILHEGEPVVISEKLHGCSGRAVYHDGRLWIGSHTQVKKHDGQNAWSRVATENKLEERLASLPDVAVYFEVYGHKVQELAYGHDKGRISIALFDSMDLLTGTYHGVEKFFQTAVILDLPKVPVLHNGPWSTSLLSLAEGKSTLADHVREGIVIRPFKERFDDRIGRVILKYIGQNYLLRP